MSVLVDSSIWIEYFRNGKDLEQLDFLIDENIVATNDLILTELTPFLKIRNQRKIIKLLHELNKLELNIDWDNIADYQYKCLKMGLNGLGIPDLIIAQNAIQNNCSLYSLDNHFSLLSKIVPLKLV
ncbi:MAG: PIN domain-containing protein [Deltaproteobacteria bacterium]|nr:PIN domain-containing protein [Deltaproteobacteria bacterium]